MTHGNSQHRGRLSAVTLMQNSETEEKIREETESGGEIERFGQNPVCPLAPPFSFVCF